MLINCKVKQLGKKRAIIENLPIEIGVDSNGQTTLQQLLVNVVNAEVKKHNKSCDEPSLLQLLPPEELSEAAAYGKVSFNEKYNRKKVAAEKAVETAITAFEDGLFFVFVDDLKVEELAQTVNLTESSTLTFLKLTMLTGGWFI